MSSPHVVVVGAGIVGSAAAYRLSLLGCQVTLIDARIPGEATAAGAGGVNPGVTHTPPPDWYPISFAAAQYYPELVAALADDGESDTGYEPADSLVVATSDDEVRQLHELLEVIRKRVATGAVALTDLTVLDTTEAREVFWPLADDIVALYSRGGARVEARRMRDAMVAGCRRRGVTVIQAGVTELAVSGGSVVETRTTENSIAGDAIVLAAGAWTRQLCEPLGVTIPVVPERGQLAHLRHPRLDGGSPLVTGFHSHYMVGFAPDRMVVGATREAGTGFDYRLTAAGAHEVLSEALRIAPGFADATVQETRVGFRPATPDKLPVLGAVDGFENLFLATGTGSSGLMMGPYVGRLVADMVLGKPTEIDTTPYELARFADGARGSS